MPVTLIRVAYFFTGAVALTYEILWARQLGLALGATTVAIAAITAAYMGGLALGSFLGGWIADAIRRPLVIYGALELAIALFALAVPTLATQVPGVDQQWLGADAELTSRFVVRFALSFLIGA